MAATVFLPVYKHGAKVLKTCRAPPIFRKYFLEIPKNQQLTVLDRNECQSQERSTLVYCNHRLYFSCQQKFDNSVFDVFYEMEEPKVGEGVRIPAPKAGESLTEGMDFTLSGRRVQPGQRGIIIHDSVKIPVQNDCLP